MICTLVTRLYGKARGNFAVGKSGAAPTGDEALRYRVVFDSLGATGWDAVTAAAGGTAIPRFGATYGNLVCVGLTPEQNEADSREWYVSAKFALPTPGSEAAPEDLDEEDGSRWAIEIAINTVVNKRAIQKSIAGVMLYNTAGDPVVGLETSSSDEEITISFTTNIVDWNAIDGCYDDNGNGAVNSYDVVLVINGEERVFAAGNLKFDGYQLATTLDASGEAYQRMTLKLLHRFRGWRAMVPSMGLWESLDGVRVPIRDDQGNLVSQQQYLAENGVRLNEGDDAFILTDPTDGEEGIRIIGEANIGTLLLWGLST